MGIFHSDVLSVPFKMSQHTSHVAVIVVAVIVDTGVVIVVVVVVTIAPVIVR